jgi:hypothetical protein
MEAERCIGEGVRRMYAHDVARRHLVVVVFVRAHHKGAIFAAECRTPAHDLRRRGTEDSSFTV